MPIGTELVEIDLLMELPVGFRPLLARIARIPECRAIGFPGQAAAGRRRLNLWDRIADRRSRRGVVDVQRADLAAALRQRDGEKLAVRRWPVPIDGRGSPGVEGVRVEQDRAAGRIGG